MTIKKSYSVNFGTFKTGLSTVGYTLAGSPRTSFGVAEAVPGSGIYAALITHDLAFSGSLVWDTGDSAPIFGVEDINPQYLAANGLDGVVIETGTTGGIPINMPQSIAVMSAVLAGRTSEDATSNTITFYAVGNPGVSRLTATTNDTSRVMVTPITS